MVPIIYMLTQDNQLRIGNGLRTIHFFEQFVGRRATGTALRSE